MAASLKALDLLSASTELRDRLEANTRWFRERDGRAGFKIVPGGTPLCPIMLGDAVLAARMAERCSSAAST